MTSNARLAQLSHTNLEKTKIVTDHLASHNLTAPSWDVDGAVDFPIPESASEAYTARVDLIATTKELHDLTLGPKQGLSWLSWDISPIWEFRVPEFVPLTGSISFEDLTAKVVAANGFKIGVMNLRRLIRHAMLNHISIEPRKGFVAHTSVSRMLLEDEPMAN
ncbi:uncharacterized protein QC763_0077980 [Podospora pseudopauciseta]|uniref:Uncharacterized protein n=1 Tax=Podospora pseudopauciseta TaxID=2093780 RepID=A0ABR0HAT6_9PEZI|nr:hypothetical protein QC763_0077980 [Podospora pseudopauciseta]